MKIPTQFVDVIDIVDYLLILFLLMMLLSLLLIMLLLLLLSLRKHLRFSRLLLAACHILSPPPRLLDLGLCLCARRCNQSEPDAVRPRALKHVSLPLAPPGRAPRAQVAEFQLSTQFSLFHPFRLFGLVCNLTTAPASSLTFFLITLMATTWFLIVYFQCIRKYRDYTFDYNDMAV